MLEFLNGFKVRTAAFTCDLSHSITHLSMSHRVCIAKVLVWICVAPTFIANSQISNQWHTWCFHLRDGVRFISHWNSGPYDHVQPTRFSNRSV